MSTRFQPFSPLPATHFAGANLESRHKAYNPRVPENRTDGLFEMAPNERPAPHEDVYEQLTDLENEPEADEFDKQLIRNAREEQSRRAQPFRLARTHPNVAVTLENLDRHNSGNDAIAAGANAHFKRESSASSTASVRSDPAIHVPTSWGRKGRTSKNWMRTIMPEENRNPGTPRYRESPGAPAADLPHPSVEESPLSHKSSLQSTPVSSRQNRFDDDWSFDLNNASVIASTPYIPRNTALDDIRQREIEDIIEEAATPSRLNVMRQNSLEEKRHSRYTSAGLTTEPSNGTGIAEQTGREPGSTQQLRKRTNSWQTIGKSQALTSQGTENSPITVYKKSVESIIATPNMRPRLSNRKEDSQDLLRKLARLSSTPSPGRASKNQTHNASTAIATRGIGQSMGEKSVAAGEPSTGTNRPEESTKAPQVSQSEAESRKEPLNLPENTSREQVYTRNSARPQSSRISSQELKTEPVASTPVPTERTLLNPKTPVVTGAWVDTPRTATVLKKPTEAPSDLTKPDRMGSPRKILKKEKTEDSADEKPQVLQPEVIRPKLPDSALQSIIEKARANGQKRSSDFGDSTINSLEELIADHTITSEAEDDIPPDYQKPTGDPRNEADRGRRDEWEHLHSLDNRLQSTSISVRRASNGIGKIERQFERRLKHHEEAGAGGQTRATSNTCTCLHHGERAPEPAKRWTFWKGLKSLFYDENLKRTSKRGWGLTGLSIVLLTFLTWFIAENLACDAFCNPVYATSMKGYGVIYGAPKFPFVLPTITYRALIRPWWRPLYSLLLLPLWNYISGLDDERAAAAATRKVGAATRVGASFTTHTVAAARRVFEEDGVVGMGGDEVLR